MELQELVERINQWKLRQSGSQIPVQETTEELDLEETPIIEGAAAVVPPMPPSTSTAANIDELIDEDNGSQEDADSAIIEAESEPIPVDGAQESDGVPEGAPDVTLTDKKPENSPTLETDADTAKTVDDDDILETEVPAAGPKIELAPEVEAASLETVSEDSEDKEVGINVEPSPVSISATGTSDALPPVPRDDTQEIEDLDVVTEE